MKTRAITLIAGLTLIATACGADVDPASDAGIDTVPTQATESTSTTMQPESPPAPENDYGVDPDAGEGATSDRSERATTTTSETATPPEGPTEVGDGKVVEPVPPQDASVPTVGEAPAALMDAIMSDLANHTGADASVFTVIHTEAVVWNDGSLGCPQPGVMYTQATVPGYWVLIDQAGTEHDYRANDSGFFVRCEGGAPPSGNPSR